MEPKQPLSSYVHIYYIFSSNTKFYFIIPIHNFGIF